MSYDPAQLYTPPNNFGYLGDNNYSIKDSSVPFLDLDQLQQEERCGEKTKKQIYKLILAKCHAKIRNTNRTTEFRQCFYDIPIGILGYPVYDIEMAKFYVIEQLKMNGIYAENFGGRRIFISWRPNDINQAQFKQQVETMRPKTNLYKVAISPMDERSAPPKKEPKVYKDESSISLLQYDDRLEDMIPVNSAKVKKNFPNFATENIEDRYNQVKTQRNYETESNYERNHEIDSKRNDQSDDYKRLDRNYESGERTEKRNKKKAKKSKRSENKRDDSAFSEFDLDIARNRYLDWNNDNDNKDMHRRNYENNYIDITYEPKLPDY